jgi:O-antigen ligase
MNEVSASPRRVLAGEVAPAPDRAGYDRIHPLVLAAFCAYIVTWFLQLGNRVEFLGEMRFEFLLGMTLIALGFVTKRQPSQTKTNLYGWLAAFFVVLVIQIPFSANVDYSWTVFVDRVIKFAFMCVFIVVFVRSPTALKWFLIALLLAWGKMGLEGMVGQITGSKVWQNQGIMRLHGSTNLYLHPNSFSGFALGMVPFIYYLLPVVNKWQKILLLVMMVFALNIILNTGSRTGYIGFLAFLAIIFLGARHKLKVAIGLVVLALVAVPYIPDQYVQRFESITGKEAEGNSKGVRLEILRDAAVIFSENPFGVGVSAFPTVREERFGRTQDTHNLYMEVLTNLGVQGFIVWALMIAAIFKNARRITRGIDEQLVRLAGVPPGNGDAAVLSEHMGNLKLMRAMLSAASAYVLLRLIVGFFGMDLYEIYWWFGLGIVLAIHNMAQVAARITEGLLTGKTNQGAAPPAAERSAVTGRPVLR